MKQILLMVAIVLVFITVLGAATNPTYEDYKAWYKEQAQAGFVEYKEGKETTEFEKSIMNFMVDMIADTSIIREDHKLYSLYIMDNYKVLGAFNKFFVLEDNIEKSTGVNAQGSN